MRKTVNDYSINGIYLNMTCGACPEQYDAYDENENKVGYLRLRHGCFTVECPDCMKELVYREYPNGDGCFNDDERWYYLVLATTEIRNWIERQQKKEPK